MWISSPSINALSLHVLNQHCNNALQQGNEKILINQVRQQFKANMNEVDDDKVRTKIMCTHSSSMDMYTHAPVRPCMARVACCCMALGAQVEVPQFKHTSIRVWCVCITSGAEHMTHDTQFPPSSSVMELNMDP